MDMEQFITGLAKEGPAKPAPRPMVLAGKWLALLFLYFTVVTLAIGLRPDIAEKMQESWFIAETLIMVAVAITAIIAASFLALPDSGQKPWVRYLPFIPLSITIMSLAYLMTRDGAMTLTECIRAGEYDCIIHIIMFAIAPALFIFTAIQKMAPSKCCWAGAMAGLSAASLGYVLLRFNEASDDAIILAVWHLLPVMVFTMLCMLLGKKSLSLWSRST